MDDIQSVGPSSVGTSRTKTSEGGPASFIPSLPPKWQKRHAGGTPKKRCERCTRNHRRCDPVSHDVSQIGQSEAYNHKDSMRSLPSCENCDRVKMSCSFCPQELRGALARWQIENPHPHRRRTRNSKACDQCRTDPSNPTCKSSMNHSECKRCVTKGRACTLELPRKREREEDHQSCLTQSSTGTAHLDLEVYNESPYQKIASFAVWQPDTHSTNSLSHFHESPELTQHTASPANEWDLLSEGGILFADDDDEQISVSELAFSQDLSYDL